MAFSFDTTSRGDDIADYVRRWYELNRETWWDRHRPNADRKGVHSDSFMLAFINEIARVSAEADRQLTRGPAGDRGQVGWLGGEFDRQ